ncbi:MAG: S8 family serine peptidase, partial [Anaerolineae bacterium]
MVATLQSAAPARPGNLAREVWEATAGGAEIDVLVLLEAQADISAAPALPGREERLRYVYDALRTTALRSQANLRAELESDGVHHRSFYIVNMISLRVDRGLATRIAAHPGVDRIVANPRVRVTLPQPEYSMVRSQTAAGVEWNVEQINADDVWELGYTGEGIVIAGQDTGYHWEHPALIDKYRGYNGVTVTHDYNWHDAIHRPGSDCGADSRFPCDDNGHGTHTMGTMVGDDGAGNRIGVAPGAQWIGCRNMDEGIGSPATYAECFEFFLAPYPIDGDPFTDGEPSLAPHVINNSWTCPPYEGCE